jgi:transcriptional regulator with XRE-family HTH domain
MAEVVPEKVRSEVAELGRRIRGLRAERGWTLDELARRSGVTKSYLSRLEDGDRQPSIATLLSLAGAFGIPMPALFEAQRPEENCSIVRAEEASAREGNGLLYTPLTSGALPFNMQPIRVTVSAERTGDELYRHDGEEWLYVLSGRLRLILGEDTHELAPGDAAHFDARMPHRLAALGGRDVELILVACAVPKRLLSTYF